MHVEIDVHLAVILGWVCIGCALQVFDGLFQCICCVGNFLGLIFEIC